MVGTTNTQRSLSSRFISCYNQVDRILRDITGAKPAMGFKETLKLASTQNSAVRCYEEDLFAYARLRNAIVHSADGEKIIAEPIEEVVENFEQITRLLKNPPLATQVLGKRNVVSVRADSPLSDAIMLITKHHYSNIPVISDGSVLCVLSPKDIVTAIGVHFATDEDINAWLDNALVGSIACNVKYCVMSRFADVHEVVEAFDEPKLKAVILTQQGTSDSKIVDIITPVDIPKLLESKNR